MPYSIETAELPAALHATLQRAIGQASITELRLLDDRLPLVLMMRGHALEAFAVGDECDYLPLYSAFKEHFLAQGAEWSTKDVSFIFCLPTGHPAAEEFCSKVEVDVYFCRKYVVQLKNDIVGSLARLPFLPLLPIEGGSIRPPSAQALLRSRTVKAELATRLVLPGTGAQTILQACVEGRYGLPAGLDGGGFEALQPVSDERRSTSVLRSISIENFRAYRKEKVFPLGTSVTVLYGPNGFGKTSFFDAVDFVVTGGVGRLAKNDTAGFAKAVKHLDSADDPTRVTLTFEREGTEHKIVRDLTDPNKATLDGKVTDRKEILANLTGGEASAGDRVDTLVALFRATHLFSQDRQELTGQVAGNCELPADIVSRMLAFDDYVNGLKKAKEVLDLAKRQVEVAQSEVKLAREQSEVDELELKRLQSHQSSDVSSEALDSRFAELKNSIERAGFDLSSLGPGRDTRGLRALLETNGAEAVAQKIMLEKCLDSSAKLRSTQLELVQHKASLAEYADALTSLETAHRKSELKLQSSEAELARQRAVEVDARSTHDALSWVIASRPEFTRLSSESANTKNRVEEVSKQRALHRHEQTTAEGILSEATEALRKAEDALKVSSARVARVKAARDWTVPSESLIAEAQAELAQITRALEDLQASLNDERHNALAQQHLVEQVQRDLKAARSEVSDIHELVAALRSHVSGGSCLLCGHDHGTAEELLRAIDIRLEQDAVLLHTSEKLAQETAQKVRLDAKCQSLVDQIRQQEHLRNQKVAQCDALERSFAEFRAILAAIDLEMANDISQRLPDIAVEAQTVERLATQEWGAAKKRLVAAEENVRAAVEAGKFAAAEAESLSRSLIETQRSLEKLVTDNRRGAYDVASELDVLTSSLTDAGVRVSRSATAAQEASKAVEEIRAEHAASHSPITPARGTLQNAFRHMSLLEGRLQALASSLAAAGLATTETADDILVRIGGAVLRLEAANALNSRVAELEIALDAAATSAAFESIRKRIADKKLVVESAQARGDLLVPWVKYFEGVYKLLVSQQATATERFTNEYGPRTAVIQRRLRPVYGFGDIEISTKGSSIAIQVSRKDEVLRPTDYFSQSQVQTLVLGLFLTACSSQTWSGFSSIMMDDPVTHFDDLNTYALLDLISGLQSSPEGSKQFVISTCDEKLLQLARQKFRHLGDAAKFYRFSAIGADGPMVAPIPA